MSRVRVVPSVGSVLSITISITAALVAFAAVDPVGASAAPVPHVVPVRAGRATTDASGPSGTVTYAAPTDAPVVDGFRPPKGEWGPGNRGVDYGTAVGSPVRAVADGVVVFSGEVGGASHVTVEHADGLRSSYSFLADIAVARGDHVRRGQHVGTTAGPFHLGFRTPDGTYLDPLAVLSGSIRPTTHLVPGADEGLDPLSAGERRSLMQLLFDTGTAAVAHLARTGIDLADLAIHEVATRSAFAVEMRATAAFIRWGRQRMHCTDVAVAAPVPDHRRIVIEVSGLGTASGSNSAWEFDTDHLGYAPDDVVRFSYNGGRVPPGGGAGPLIDASGPGWSEFDGVDSQQPVGVSADRLADLIAATARDDPGVPIDVFAHSQGGVVARLAIERSSQAGDLPSSVSTLVTVGSPHGGAPLATGVTTVGVTPSGRELLGAVRTSGLAEGLDDRLPAIADLAETSPVIEELHRTPMPEQVRFVSLGGAGDLVVPGVATTDQAADDQRILPTGFDPDAHSHLPSDPRVTRELGLAIAGLPLTCQSLADAAGAFLTSEAIAGAESMAGLGLALGASGAPPALVAQSVMSGAGSGARSGAGSAAGSGGD